MNLWTIPRVHCTATPGGSLEHIEVNFRCGSVPRTVWLSLGDCPGSAKRNTQPGGHFANNDLCHLVRIVWRYDREQHTYLQEFAVVIEKDPIEESWETITAKELQIDDVPKKKKIKAAPPKPDWKLRKRQMRERSVADSRIEEEQAVMERYAKQQDEALFVGW